MAVARAAAWTPVYFIHLVAGGITPRHHVRLCCGGKALP